MMARCLRDRRERETLGTSLNATKPDQQFKRAQELKATFTAKFDSDSYVRIRNLKTRVKDVASVNDVPIYC
jgi:hypothetical protein